MNRIILISIIIFSFTINSSYAQKASKYDSVNILKVINQDIYHILDSIIEHEKKCDYYSENLVFDVWITPDYIQFSTIGKQRHLIGIERGLFFHKNHIVFVSGQQDETLFKPTFYKLLYEYDVSTDYTDPETGEVYLYIFENDAYSFWVYKYDNKKFILEDIHTYCDDNN